MKIEVHEKPAAPKWPRLMQGEGGMIVLFTAPCCGTVIRHPYHEAGEYLSEWPMPNFAPFTGSVTLSND